MGQESIDIGAQDFDCAREFCYEVITIGRRQKRFSDTIALTGSGYSRPCYDLFGDRFF